MFTHDLMNFSAMLLSGILGALLVTPAQHSLAVVRRRIGDERSRRHDI